MEFWLALGIALVGIVVAYWRGRCEGYMRAVYDRAIRDEEPKPKSEAGTMLRFLYRQAMSYGNQPVEGPSSEAIWAIIDDEVEE